VLFGPAYDPVTSQWKKLAFYGFILTAALVLYIARSKPQHRFIASLLLAIIVVLFVLIIHVFR